MTKERYMALADFQSLWTDTIKPALDEQYDTAERATVAESRAAAAELT